MVGSIYGNLLTNILMSIWMYYLIFRRKYKKIDTIALCVITGFVCEVLSLSVSYFFKNDVINAWFAILLPTIYVLVSAFLLSNFDTNKTFFIYLAYFFVFDYINLITSIISKKILCSDSYVALIVNLILNVIMLYVFSSKIKRKIHKGILSFSGNTILVNAVCVDMIFIVAACLIMDLYNGSVTIYSIIIAIGMFPLIIIIYRIYYNIFFSTEYKHELEKIEILNEYLNEIVMSAQSRIDGITKYSNNNELNVILTSFKEIIESRGIKFEIVCDELTEIIYSKFDLLALFGNLLNFGISTNNSTRIDNGIFLSIRESGNTVTIKFRSRCKTYIRYKNGVPYAEFINDASIKSILQTIIKYSGDYEFSNDDDYVYVNIIMNNFLTNK